MKKRYRNRVSLILYREDNKILVSMEDGVPVLPGGGTENGKITNAAKREALEEVGFEIDKVRSLRVKPVEFLWPEDFKKKQEEKGRTHDGWRNYVRVAKLGKSNKKHFDVEGDGKKNIKYMPVEDIIAVYDKKAKDPKNSWREMDKQTLAALRETKEKLEMKKLGAYTVLFAAGLLHEDLLDDACPPYLR